MPGFDTIVLTLKGQIPAVLIPQVPAVNQLIHFDLYVNLISVTIYNQNELIIAVI